MVNKVGLIFPWRQYFDVASRAERNDITTMSGAKCTNHTQCSWGDSGVGVVGACCPPRTGFTQAVLGTLRLKADGLLHLGPPGGSFVWLNLATSKRSRTRPYGDESKPYVNTASLTLC